MATFDLIDENIIRIGETATSPSGDISPFITQLSVSLTMDASSEIQFTVIDKDFIFARNNYFQLRRNVYYRDLVFEISRVDVSQDESSYPAFTIAARSKNIQLMKRDKEPEGFSGLTPTEFASTIAARFNMQFYGEETSEVKNIVKGSSSRADESTYDVLMRVASEIQFTCFETQDTLFFTSQENLLGKWGDPAYLFGDSYVIPIEWPEPDEEAFPSAGNKYRLIEMPSVGKSDDDWKFAEGSFLIERVNGVKLRPGMTINLDGIPDFEGLYLITAVEFDEGVPDPVQVSFRSPDDPDPPQKGSGVGGNNSYTNNNNTRDFPQNIYDKITSYIARNYTPSSIPNAIARSQIARAEYRNNQIEAVNNFTLAEAFNIWTQKLSPTAVDAAIAAVGNKTENRTYKGVPYRALQFVASDLKRIDVVGLRIPNSLRVNMINHYASLIGYSPGANNNTVEWIVNAAQAVYNETSAAKKDEKFNKLVAEADTLYGSNSPARQVLEKYKTTIMPTQLDVFTGQYFPTTVVV